MRSILLRALGWKTATEPWSSAAPIRAELFGAERLEQHAESLAAEQPVTDSPILVLPLSRRLKENAAVLLGAYRASAVALEQGRGIAPAAEWLLDNYHLVEEQIREIRDDLPPGYYRQLPKLASGPFAGYPRVLGLAWAFIAHTDSHVDLDVLRRFVRAYQRVQPLTIGELWAVAITLRIVLVENLRRLAVQITEAEKLRLRADSIADQLLATSESPVQPLREIVAAFNDAPLPELFAGQLAKRLRDVDPRVTPGRGWLEERLSVEGSSIEEVVRRTQQRQGASNVTMRNIITSMRLISNGDWADFFESVSLVDSRLAAGSGFAAMDFATRNRYRSAIEELARRAPVTELDIADRALELAHAAGSTVGADSDRMAEPGYYLIAGGRPVLERAIGFRTPARLRIGRLAVRSGIGGYISAILLVALSLLGIVLALFAGQGVGVWWLLLLGMTGLVPVLEASTALVNLAVTRAAGASILAGLELADGVPAQFRTVVAVPMLLTGEDDLREVIERLEVHYLASAGGELYFALLSDGPDADAEIAAGDAELLAVAAEEIAALNARHGPGLAGERFRLLHRRRLYNAGEGRWIGWERKRGKLHELNRLLRGARDTTFLAVAGQPPSVPPGVRYVITLDADTRLPRDAARRLIGKLAHPLNRARLDAEGHRVVDGYGVLQPRVTPSLPLGRDGSFYQRIFSGPAGMDPYAAAASDVYQDLFGEGSYTGKGIYDVDAFESALRGRVPENTMLSHDLFEGSFARSGLASDVEVVEEFPARYDVAAKRQHRWVRGDWQLLPWIVGAGTANGGGVPAVGRGKMLDNLRRSLVAPLAVAGLLVGWLLPLPAALNWTGFILAALAVPALLPIPFAILPRRGNITARSHLTALGRDMATALAQIALNIVFLADQAWLMGDAISRTLHRLFVSRRHLLEWVTAAQTRGSPRPGMLAAWREMRGGVALAIGVGVVTLVFAPASWPVMLPFVVLWLAAPGVAHSISQSQNTTGRKEPTPSEARALRLIGRETWRYFETFVTPADRMLPPDNFQEDPKPVVAHRTSPTNMGLYLLSAVAARDLGWSGTYETLERLETTLETMGSLARFRGHFFNWYDTRDLRVLEPPYVSSVDSGNLAGHLIALANSCPEWMDSPPDEADVRKGLTDALDLAQGTLSAMQVPDDDLRQRLAAILEEMAARLGSDGEADFAALTVLARAAARTAEAIARLDAVRADASDPGLDLIFWTGSLERRLREHARDVAGFASEPRAVADRLAAVAVSARELAMAMDFAFLLDPEKKLLSIGFSVADNSRDASCYDLLASEARLGSLFAIAKGDVPTRHWFRLGRTATPLGAGSALISWSGSMFEYLMPSLVMRAPAGSVLEQTNRLIVARQQAYGRALGIPWGVSESAYSARDLEFTYQYSNFGVPGLGLKRGLSENAVIAPYATGLAAMVDPAGAVRNYARLAALGARGRYGFYEALDFTRSRLPESDDVAIVRNFMAHHQGMTIVAIGNALNDGCMRTRFHREPIIQASDLLLQERVPRDVAAAHPRAEEVTVAATEPSLDPATVRRLTRADQTPPATHLLSNGRYSVMLTAAGSGYSCWRDLAVTRWREDVTRDDRGTYIFLRDVQSGALWSAGFQPTRAEPDSYEVLFAEDSAAYVRHDGSLTTMLDILVSSEDDAEVRRVTIINGGRRPREIDITSYAEVVLAPQSADIAHPAFSKLFVVTEYLPEYGALIATRRRRSPGDPEVWGAHLAVVEGTLSAAQQVETDRARFIGRGRSAGDAAAVTGGEPLSNTVGAVLDPIFAIRHRLRIPPGEHARVDYWTIVAASRAELLDAIDRHRDRNGFERATTLAWTQAQVQLRHLGITGAEAADFQRLAGPILHADPEMRPSSDVIVAGAGGQSGLWQHGISGDLPIVLLRIDDVEDIDQVRQMLRAHEYWSIKQLAVDLVILNERLSSYVQDLQVVIETSVRSAQAKPRFGEAQVQGAVHMLRADLMTAEARALLQSVARVVLIARRGDIARQNAQLADRVPFAPRPPAKLPAVRPLAATAWPELEFFNGLGGFAKEGREYVTVLGPGKATPAPWINVIANPGFGFQVSADGSGYTWAQNSRENQLTPWSNDPVSDPSGEAIYLRDEESGALWSPTALPIRGDGVYVSHHGFGYSRFEHTSHGIAAELLQFVPLDDQVKIMRLRVRNLSGRARTLSVTAYAEWVLGTQRGASAPFIVTETDPQTGALLARNPWNSAFPGRVAFADIGRRPSAWTADRRAFIGRNGSLADPAALRGPGRLTGRDGAGLDPCAALQRQVTLDAEATADIVVLLGEAADADAARELVARYRVANPEAILEAVARHWDDVLGAVQVRTPDRAMDILLNGWLLYQTLACRIWARAGFYQASGAYGFRDQLQDGMAMTFARPEMTRAHLLRAAARQFPEGDVQHWWLPHSGQGVRTRISDDRVWLAYGVATYVEATGDAAILDEVVGFLDGPALAPGQHDAFFQPAIAEERAALFEHCARGLDQTMELTGADGIPLIGTGDWNDGMNRVGAEGRGTSVWLGWLLIAAIDRFAPLAEARDPDRARRWRAHANLVRAAIERDGWDGAWYRRGTFDDGSPLGASTSDECRIDSIAQSWAVLSGAAEPGRAAQAMASVHAHLIREDAGVALLFTPPFDKTPRDPGYIKGYPPGLRENGGQYSHAAMWAVLAYARLGQGDRASALFAMLNPINHTRSPVETARYRVEPYVVAADVYSVAPHEGRGGWTWYTGSAGWMYRAGLEGILGIRQQAGWLLVDPCIPQAWPGFEIVLRWGTTRYQIAVENPSLSGRGVRRAELDDRSVTPDGGVLRVPLDGGEHRLRIFLGAASAMERPSPDAAA